MTRKKNKNYCKGKRKSKKNKNKKVNCSDKKTSKAVPCLSKRQPSANWLNFIKTNSGTGFAFKIRKTPMSDTTVEKKLKPPAITKVVALDCEMVGDMDDRAVLARVSIVNFKLECIYDQYVKPETTIGNYRTRFSGIREEDLNKGLDFQTVQSEVRNLLFNKILVGHALHNDLRVLKFGHHRSLIRDTATYPPFKEACDSSSPSLKKLAKVFLNKNIQEGEHNSVEDAKTAMTLYTKFRKEWEMSLNKTNKIQSQSESVEAENELIV